ncbi:MAG: CDP-glycerol glycerophosphotransferase family protein [Bacteroidales bacterium]|nr:CDP-glycerol glycerophosphotransferase family protein [Bacteroidales bacterium]
MVFSYYLYYFPYRFIWKAKNFFKKENDIAFYCGDYLDYLIFKPVLKYLPEIKIISKNKKVKKELEKHNIKSKLWPCFPKSLIMVRHDIHMFPEKNIKKIGMRHGVYHFKNFISSKKYNYFDKFLFTSSTELKQAEKLGIKNGANVGFPKIDPLFNGEINSQTIKKLKNKIFPNTKPIIIFSATWDKSGMSAIEKWYKKLDLISDDYNIIVTLHPWISNKYKLSIANNKNIFFIKDKNILPYLAVSDLMVGDTSSIIAEFCSLNKPIITFKINQAKRLSDEIITMLDEISIRVENFNECVDAIKYSLKNNTEKSNMRIKWNNIMLDNLDGNAAKRAAKEIKNTFEL